MSEDYHPANLGNGSLSEMGIVSCFVKLPLALAALIKGKIRREKLYFLEKIKVQIMASIGAQTGANFTRQKFRRKLHPAEFP